VPVGVVSDEELRAINSVVREVRCPCSVADMPRPPYLHNGCIYDPHIGIWNCALDGTGHAAIHPARACVKRTGSYHRACPAMPPMLPSCSAWPHSC
jgi:hypothetical protein